LCSGEIKRRAKSEKDEQSSALAQLAKALAGLEAVALSWRSPSLRSNVFSLRYRSGNTSALAFESEFATFAALMDKAREGILLAVAVG
jgi:hypothetical protein